MWLAIPLTCAAWTLAAWSRAWMDMCTTLEHAFKIPAMYWKGNAVLDFMDLDRIFKNIGVAPWLLPCLGVQCSWAGCKHAFFWRWDVLHWCCLLASWNLMYLSLVCESGNPGHACTWPPPMCMIGLCCHAEDSLHWLCWSKHWPWSWSSPSGLTCSLFNLQKLLTDQQQYY